MNRHDLVEHAVQHGWIVACDDSDQTLLIDSKDARTAVIHLTDNGDSTEARIVDRERVTMHTGRGEIQRPQQPAALRGRLDATAAAAWIASRER